MNASGRVALLTGRADVLVEHLVNEGLDHPQLRLGPLRVMLRRRQGTRDRPAHHAPMNPELCRHSGDRADPKFVLPTELLEQFHFGFPVHKRHPDSIEMTVGSRTGGGPKLASTPGPKFDSIASLFNAFIKNELVDLPHTSARCRIIGRPAIGTLASGLLGRLFDSPISM